MNESPAGAIAGALVGVMVVVVAAIAVVLLVVLVLKRKRPHEPDTQEKTVENPIYTGTSIVFHMYMECAWFMAVDKFLSLGVLTSTTHYEQLCCVLYPSHKNAKSLGVLQHSQAPPCLRPCGYCM